VALLVDTFGSRQIDETCSKSEMGALDFVNDAFGALAYLRDLPFVKADRIGVMGWDVGGEAALSSIDGLGSAQLYKDHFSAGVALYSGLSDQAKFLSPVLILLPGDDDWSPLQRTQKYADKSKDESQPIEMVVYPHTFPGFDDPERGAKFYMEKAFNPRSTTGKGATFGYDDAAAADVRLKVQDFLARYLK
jgi:dienelactone hydrolase